MNLHTTHTHTLDKQLSIPFLGLAEIFIHTPTLSHDLYTIIIHTTQTYIHLHTHTYIHTYIYTALTNTQAMNTITAGVRAQGGVVSALVEGF